MTQTTTTTRTAILAAAVLGLTVGTAAAQPDAHLADRTRTAHMPGGPPGTVGAMENVVRGLATSPQDVAAQQAGLATAAEGNRPLEGRSAAGGPGHAPGTVGAAPGSDTER